MANSVPYIIAALLLGLLVFGLVQAVRGVRRNRSGGGALLAAMMLFASWVPPPPRPETEDQTPQRKTGGDSDLIL